jgi:FixJ family two-component response regulator
MLTGFRQAQPVIFISGDSDVPTSVTAMKAGAVDFLTKPVTSDDLLTAIKRAIEKDNDARRSRTALDDVKDRVAKLTPREKAVFEQVVIGKLNKQIAGSLGIVEKTVKVHRARMMKKMGVRTLAELVQLAERLGAANNQGLPS